MPLEDRAWVGRCPLPEVEFALAVGSGTHCDTTKKGFSKTNCHIKRIIPRSTEVGKKPLIPQPCLDLFRKAVALCPVRLRNPHRSPAQVCLAIRHGVPCLFFQLLSWWLWVVWVYSGGGLRPKFHHRDPVPIQTTYSRKKSDSWAFDGGDESAASRGFYLHTGLVTESTQHIYFLMRQGLPKEET